MGDRQTIILSDFDGTLTSRDTLIEFLRYAKGTAALLAALLLFSPLLVLMKLHLYSNGRAKQRLFSYFFKDMALEDFDDVCRRFAKARQDLLRRGGKEMIADAAARGIPVFVVSASIDNWVLPFFDVCASFCGHHTGENTAADGFRLTVIGTQIEVCEGKLTGRFLTPNCYGGEKVTRVRAAVPELASNRPHYYIIAYGDSRGDKEMLDFADEGHYKPFRS